MATASATEAERSLLGALLIDGKRVLAAEEFVSPAHFGTVAHAAIYEAVSALRREGLGVDLTTVSDRLERQGRLFAVGGAAYLSGLMDSVPDVENVPTYAKIVADAAIRRKLQAQGKKIAASAQVQDAAAVIEEAQRDLLSLGATGGTKTVHATVGVGAFAKSLERTLSRGGALLGAPTGFERLDEATGGYQGPDLVIVAGRPGMGKTSFVTKAALAAAVAGKSVLFVSLEMSAAQLSMRMICDLAGVPLKAVRDGEVSASERVAMALAASVVRKSRLWIDDAAHTTVQDIHARAERLRQAKGLDLVIVDYIGLLSSRGRTENRTQEVGAFSRGLKALAKDLNVPVVALSQLSRQIEQREDREPQLSDLRESGSIEQDADIVIFLSRSAYYDQTAERQHLAEVIIAKHRNGAPGRFTVGWLGELTRFADLKRTEQA